MRTIKHLIKEDTGKEENEPQNEIPEEITLEYFTELVKKMRHYQRRYFATRNAEILTECRRLEKQIDTVIMRSQYKQLTLF